MDYKTYLDEFHTIMATLSKRRIHQATTESTKGEMGTLMCLTFEKDGVTSGELKEKLHVASGRISDILRALESKGLITRVQNQEDNRKVMVYITEEGREIAIKHQELVHRKLMELMDFLGEEDTKELIRLMKRVEEYRGKNENE